MTPALIAKRANIMARNHALGLPPHGWSFVHATLAEVEAEPARVVLLPIVRRFSPPARWAA